MRRYTYGQGRLSLTEPATGGPVIHYYHYDQLGSVANLTSATGTTEWTYAYDPFGTTRTETQNDPSAPVNMIKFTAELLDPTGLYYLRARQYDPGTGRFLRSDPVPQEIAAPPVAGYAYTDDRPTVMVDPTGMTLEPYDMAIRLARRIASLTEPACSLGFGDRTLAAARPRHCSLSMTCNPFCHLSINCHKSEQIELDGPDCRAVPGRTFQASTPGRGPGKDIRHVWQIRCEDRNTQIGPASGYIDDRRVIGPVSGEGSLSLPLLAQVTRRYVESRVEARVEVRGIAAKVGGFVILDTATGEVMAPGQQGDLGA